MKRWRRIKVPSWVPVAMTVGVLVAQVGIATAPPRPVQYRAVGGPAIAHWHVAAAVRAETRPTDYRLQVPPWAELVPPIVLERASRSLVRPPLAERSRWSTRTAPRATPSASSSSPAVGASTRTSVSSQLRTASGGVALARLLPEPWRSIVRCESLGDGSWRVSAASRARGFFQFMPSTWRSLGMSGDPAEAPFSVQYAAARKLRERDGLGAWDCARILGWA